MTGSGIYKIVNNITGIIYIGSAVNLVKRKIYIVCRQSIYN